MTSTKKDFANAATRKSTRSANMCQDDYQQAFRIIHENDHAALDLFIENNYSLFLSFTASRMHNKELVCDVVQDSITKIYAQWEKKQSGQSSAFCKQPEIWRTWVYTILNHTAERQSKLESRQNKGRPAYSTTEENYEDGAGLGQNFRPEIESPYFSLSPIFEDPLTLLEITESRRLLDEIKELSKTSQDISAALLMGLRKVDPNNELGHTEASDTEINPVTIRTRALRGRKILKEIPAFACSK